MVIILDVNTDRIIDSKKSHEWFVNIGGMFFETFNLLSFAEPVTHLINGKAENQLGCGLLSDLFFTIFATALKLFTI